MAQGVDPDIAGIDTALQTRRQGDVWLGDSLDFTHVFVIKAPLTAAAREASQAVEWASEEAFAAAQTAVAGLVILTQTCDLVRPCAERPFVEVAPLVPVESEDVLAQVRSLRRPQYALVPALVDQKLVADLDRVMTIEKAVIAQLQWRLGVTSDDEARAFANALARKRLRVAFPDDFNAAMAELQKRMNRRAQKDSDEGAHVDCIDEIRVSATPSWEAPQVQVTIRLIKSRDPTNADWEKWTTEWADLFVPTGAFELMKPLLVVTLEDMTALDYVTSDRLDLDHLSRSKP